MAEPRKHIAGWIHDPDRGLYLDRLTGQSVTEEAALDNGEAFLRRLFRTNIQAQRRARQEDT